MRERNETGVGITGLGMTGLRMTGLGIARHRLLNGRIRLRIGNICSGLSAVWLGRIHRRLRVCVLRVTRWVRLLEHSIQLRGGPVERGVGRAGGLCQENRRLRNRARTGQKVSEGIIRNFRGNVARLQALPVRKRSQRRPNVGFDGRGGCDRRLRIGVGPVTTHLRRL